MHAQAEVSRIRSPIEKASKIASYARVFAAELLGLVSAVPYGVRALALHRSLPSPDARLGRHQGSVTLLRDVRRAPQRAGCPAAPQSRAPPFDRPTAHP